MKATVAPPTAVFLQPKWSVNMLTTGEQRKIMPIARAPTQAGEEEEGAGGRVAVAGEKGRRSRRGEGGGGGGRNYESVSGRREKV